MSWMCIPSPDRLRVHTLQATVVGSQGKGHSQNIHLPTWYFPIISVCSAWEALWIIYSTHPRKRTLSLWEVFKPCTCMCCWHVLQPANSIHAQRIKVTLKLSCPKKKQDFDSVCICNLLISRRGRAVLSFTLSCKVIGDTLNNIIVWASLKWTLDY